MAVEASNELMRSNQKILQNKMPPVAGEMKPPGRWQAGAPPLHSSRCSRTGILLQYLQENPETQVQAQQRNLLLPVQAPEAGR